MRALQIDLVCNIQKPVVDGPAANTGIMHLTRHHSPMLPTHLVAVPDKHKAADLHPVDPTPIGLAGFSSVVFMVSAYYAGFVANLKWVAPLGMLAGITLLVGSIFHFYNRHTLPATNFGVYGAFWLSVATYMMVAPNADFDSIMTCIRIPLAVFTLYAWIASFFVSKASLFIFTTLEIKLICFIVGQISEQPIVMKVGGWFGMLCAASGWYVSASLLLRPYLYLPLGAPMLTPQIPITNHKK